MENHGRGAKSIRVDASADSTYAEGATKKAVGSDHRVHQVAELRDAKSYVGSTTELQRKETAALYAQSSSELAMWPSSESKRKQQ
jgi:hypothetical protein